MRVFAVLGLTLLLSACSETPTETKAKEPAKLPAPITARQAFQYTYPAARGWAGDCLPLHVRSIHLTDVPSQDGKAGAWEITYVSAAQQAARIYTWSAVDAPGPLHEGVFAGKTQSWSGSSGQEKPFTASAFHIDTSGGAQGRQVHERRLPGQAGNQTHGELPAGVHAAISGSGVARDVGRNAGLRPSTPCSSMHLQGRWWGRNNLGGRPDGC